MEQAKISENCKNQNYLNKIVVKAEIREEMRNDLKVKRRCLDQKLMKRLEKGKNNDFFNFKNGLKNEQVIKNIMKRNMVVKKKLI